MSTFTLADLGTLVREVGRGTIWQSLYWDGTADIALTHVGDTLGPIRFNPNESFSTLTSPETTGGAILKRRSLGSAPSLTVPLYVADPTVIPLLSAMGTASGGFSRAQPVVERTVVIFPEEMFFDPTETNPSLRYKAAAYTTAGGWTVGGVAMTTRQLQLLAQSIWLWRCHWETPPWSFSDDEHGRAVGEATLHVMYDSTKPEGHRLYTRGNPATLSPTPIVLDVP